MKTSLKNMQLLTHYKLKNDPKESSKLSIDKQAKLEEELLLDQQVRQ